MPVAEGGSVKVDPPVRGGAWEVLLDAGEARFGGPIGARLASGTVELPGWGALILGG